MPIYNLDVYFQDIADAIRSKQPAPTSKNAKTYDEYNTLLLSKTGYGLNASSHLNTYTVNKTNRLYFVQMKNTSNTPYLLMIKGFYTTTRPTLSDIVVADSGSSVSVTNLIPSSVSSYVDAIWFHLKNGAWGDYDYEDEMMIDPNQTVLIPNMSLDGDPFTNELPPVVPKYTPDQFAQQILNL